ncbi:hypothetical protein Q604_UNBC10502G0001, partial [human gut metagenome]
MQTLQPVSCACVGADIRDEANQRAVASVG